MLKKILVAAAVAAIAKLVLDKLTGNRDAELWAEATDSVESNR